MLFVVTELERPVGGLHRFTVEFASKWKQAVRKPALQLLGFCDPFSQREEGLQPAVEYSAFGHKVFFAERAGQRAVFIEPNVDAAGVDAVQAELWKDYGVRSLKASSWDYYRALCAFWQAVPEFVEFSRRELNRDFSLVDCQDWLAFPAGFLCRKKLGIPLHCRFHSTEMGRAMGKPDVESAPFSIEVASLLEADFVQGVSVSEAKFLLYNYLPFAQELANRLAPSKPPGWAAYANRKIEAYQDFLVSEAQDLVLMGEHAAGIPNGIILADWLTVSKQDIQQGRQFLKQILPGKRQYIMFVGRTETRKGIAQLIDAVAMLDDDSVGLVLVSSFAPDAQARYEQFIASRGLAGRVAIHSGWVGEREKKGLFCACDVMAFPSLYEPFGLVCLEGLAADLAAKRNGLQGPVVVAGATGGLNEILRTGLNGFKAPMEEFDLKPELLLRVLRLALKNKASDNSVAGEGAKRVQDPHFNWATIARLVAKSYATAVKNFSSRGGLMKEPEEIFGVNSGKVWLCLKGEGALSISQLKSKAKLSTDEVAGALGWLSRENKIYLEDSGKVMKYGLRE
ncbi:MAG: glycosyltransferase [Candidatus Micrarchaeota archaeon]